MQAAIDNAKRRFDIDIMSEIQRIKEDMNVTENGYPVFWKIIRPDFNMKRINPRLNCPMNYLCTVKPRKFKSKYSTLPMSDFFIKHKLETDRRKCKRIEELITKYSLELYNFRMNEDSDYEDYLLLRSDFEDILKDIRKINISKNYTGLISWLIDRAFIITPAMRSNSGTLECNLNRNRSLLMKTLYRINKNSFMSCFKSS